MVFEGRKMRCDVKKVRREGRGGVGVWRPIMITMLELGKWRGHGSLQAVGSRRQSRSTPAGTGIDRSSSIPFQDPTHHTRDSTPLPRCLVPPSSPQLCDPRCSFFISPSSPLSLSLSPPLSLPLHLHPFPAPYGHHKRHPQTLQWEYTFPRTCL
jgi:hypothetical protein